MHRLDGGRGVTATSVVVAAAPQAVAIAINDSGMHFATGASVLQCSCDDGRGGPPNWS
jgi:hypothetical protein